jgi:hypothetical protein
MYLARTYSAHNSFVDHMEVSMGNNENTACNYLYSNGIYDQCIVKWKIGYENTTPRIEDGSDIFGDVPSHEQL